MSQEHLLPAKQRSSEDPAFWGTSAYLDARRAALSAQELERRGVSANQWLACEDADNLLSSWLRSKKNEWNLGRLESLAAFAEKSLAGLRQLLPAMDAAERFFFALSFRDGRPSEDVLTQRCLLKGATPEKEKRAKDAASRVLACFDAAENAALAGLDIGRPIAFGFLPLSGLLTDFTKQLPAHGAPNSGPLPIRPHLTRCACLQGHFHVRSLGIARSGAFLLSQDRLLDTAPLVYERMAETSGSPMPVAPILWPASKSLPALQFWTPSLRIASVALCARLFFRGQQAVDHGLGLSAFGKRNALLAFLDLGDSEHGGRSGRADAWRWARGRFGAQALAEHFDATEKADVLLPWLQATFASRLGQATAEIERMAKAFSAHSRFWAPKEHPQWALASHSARLSEDKLKSKALASQAAGCVQLLSRLGFKATGQMPDGSLWKSPGERPTPLFSWVDMPPAVIEAVAPVLRSDGVDFNARSLAGQSALGRLNSRARVAEKQNRSGVSVFDPSLEALVSLGATPSSIAPVPSASGLAATPAMLRLVKAQMERDELFQSLSDADLRRAIDFWREHGPGQHADAPKPPRKRL